MYGIVSVEAIFHHVGKAHLDLQNVRLFMISR
jgi:hypothetical protein